MVKNLSLERLKRQSMSLIEKKAFDWLLRQGYREEDITYNPNSTPDFVTSDGRGWEVKRLYKGRIEFTKNQLEVLKKSPNITVLVFAPRSEEPVLTFKGTDVKMGAVINGIVIGSAKKKRYRVSFTLSRDAIRILNLLRRVYDDNASRAVETAIWFVYGLYKQKQVLPRIMRRFYDVPDRLYISDISRRAQRKPRNTITLQLGVPLPLEVEEGG